MLSTDPEALAQRVAFSFELARMHPEESAVRVNQFVISLRDSSGYLDLQSSRRVVEHVLLRVFCLEQTQDDCDTRSSSLQAVSRHGPTS